ncbi:TetR family transcriptional regulator [Peribacillus deserti]|uniref:TetR family transcriptional regulator n=1 Tax=Peribacillus deserti TaxID=673318 RepID=UPI002152422B|nr:TetR family transcriptional regulator [Peribacillus deserti]
MSQEYKEKRRQEILDTARKVFIQKGFDQTTMTDIVEASGLSRGGVYQYFSSTDEMFRQITDRNDEGFENWIKKIIGESKTAWAAIENYLAEVEAGLLEPGVGFGIVQFEYFVFSTRKEERSSYLLKRGETAIRNFSLLIENGMKTGEFKPIQPTEAIVMFIININDGLLLQSLTLNKYEHDRVYVKEQIQGLKMYLKQVLQVE